MLACSVNLSMLHYFIAPSMVSFIGTKVDLQREVVIIQWNPPWYPNGRIYSYELTLSVLEDYGLIYNSTSYSLNASTMEHTLSWLGMFDLIYSC